MLLSPLPSLGVVLLSSPSLVLPCPSSSSFGCGLLLLAERNQSLFVSASTVTTVYDGCSYDLGVAFMTLTVWCGETLNTGHKLFRLDIAFPRETADVPVTLIQCPHTETYDGRVQMKKHTYVEALRRLAPILQVCPRFLPSAASRDYKVNASLCNWNVILMLKNESFRFCILFFSVHGCSSDLACCASFPFGFVLVISHTVRCFIFFL